MPELSIFVSHTRGQSAAVRRLTADLTSRGFSIAPNRHNVPPGKRVQPVVEQSMTGAIRCLVCFSAKPGGPAEYDKDDVVLANERLRAQLTLEAWVIPVKLTACDIQAIDFGGVSAHGLGAIELHDDWNAEIERLFAALPTPPGTTPATLPIVASPPAHAQMFTEVQTAQAKEADFTNVQGSQAANATATQKFGNLTVDGRLTVTNVKG